MVKRTAPLDGQPGDAEIPEAAARTKPLKSRAYNLVVLAVAVTLLNIWVASTLPLWSHQIERDKEAELIFRGLQYAEAIRLFQLRNGRLPNKLKELIEVEPRCIRKLWENPMREDGRWGLIPLGLDGPGQRNPGQQPGQPGQPGDLGGDAGPSNATGGGLFPESGKKGETPGVILSEDPNDTFGAPPSSVAIRGVYSPEGDEAIHIYMGQESPSQWKFTVDVFATMKQGAPANPALVTPFLAAEIGRPWPPGITPQVPQPSDRPIKAQGTAIGNAEGGHQPIRGQQAEPVNPTGPSTTSTQGDR